MTPQAYTPVYWDIAMPALKGIFSKEIHAKEIPKAQRATAICLQTFLKGAATEDIGFLEGTRTPALMLIQLPNSNAMCFVTGLARLHL